MRFFIAINGFWVEKPANLMAVMQDVKDETLDTANVELLADDREEPYEVRSYCYIQEGEDKTYYRLATDNVSIFSLQPKTYKHSLSLVQTTRELSHYVLPNMVITKPREKASKAFFSTTNTLNMSHYWSAATPTSGLPLWEGFMGANFDTVAPNDVSVARDDMNSRYWSEPFACSKNEKIEEAELRVSYKALKVTGLNASSASKANAKWTTLKRTPTAPSFIKAYALVYHTSTNTSRALWDKDIANKATIAKIPLANLSWQGEYLSIKLTSDQLSSLNAYDDGYIAIDIVSDVTGTIPSSLKADSRSVLDRLFTDVSEFTTNGYEYVTCNMELAFTYKRTFLYDTLKKIVARQQSEYSLGNKKPLFKLPTSGDDYDVLTTTESPEFSFSGQTVFEAVSQVLSTIDALPRFDFVPSADGVTDVLHLDYLNKHGEEIAYRKFNGQSSGLGEEKYVNGILTNYQKAEVLRKFPSGVEGTYTNVRLKSYGVPELKDFAMVMDKPIKYIKKLQVKTQTDFQVVWKNASNVYAKYTASVDIPIDLSPFTFEESVYSTALSDRGEYSNDNHNERLQMNCLKFTQGSKNIDLGNKVTDGYNHAYMTFWNCWKIAFDRMFGSYATNTYTGTSSDQTPWFGYVLPKENDFSSVYFRSEYASDVDGRIIVESPTNKAKGEMNASASGASIDLNKLGLNMLGLSMRTGVPTLTYGQVISKWDNRIKVGQTLEKDGCTWVANKCQYQVIDQSKTGIDHIKGTIEFTRDFNGLAKRIAIDQNKRFSNISSSIVDKCEVNVINYVTLAPSRNKNAVFKENASATPIDLPMVARLMGKPFGEAFGGSLQGGKLYEPLDVDFARYYLEPQSSGVRDVFMPITVYGSGNCICYEASFDNAISAGVRMDVTAEGNGKWWDVLQTITNSKQYFGKDVKYADDEGYAETISIDYVSGNGATFPSTFPYIPNSGTNKVGTLLNLKFNKMPNEIVAVNYELAFVSKAQSGNGVTFMGRKFFDLINKTMRADGCKLYLSEEKYSILDDKAKGTAYDIGQVQTVRCEDYSASTPYRDYYLKVTLTSGVSIPEKDYRSYCLADEEGNILVACNFAFRANSDSPLPIVHFTTSPERLE